MPPMPPNELRFQDQFLNPINIINTIIVVANIVLLVVLLCIYLKNYRKIKSKFTIGLVLFASLLLLQNVLSVSFALFFEAFGGPEVGSSNFFLNITEFMALSVLLFITWE